MSLYFLTTVAEVNLDNVLDKLKEHGFSDVKWPVLAVSLRQGGAVQGIQTNVLLMDTSLKLNALIKHWLENDKEASWKKLVIAMVRSDQKVAAEKLAGEFGIPYPLKE